MREHCHVIADCARAADQRVPPCDDLTPKFCRSNQPDQRGSRSGLPAARRPPPAARGLHLQPRKPEPVEHGPVMHGHVRDLS